MKFGESQFNALTPDEEKKNVGVKTSEVLPDNLEPIAEDENSISYLGVTLEKAKSGHNQFVPKREQYEDLIGELSQTMLQMKKGENCNPKHLTELFRAMSHPLFKEFMESFFKRTFQHYSSIVLSRLIPYAEKSGFNIRL